MNELKMIEILKEKDIKDYEFKMLFSKYDNNWYVNFDNTYEFDQPCDEFPLYEVEIKYACKSKNLKVALEKYIKKTTKIKARKK